MASRCSVQVFFAGDFILLFKNSYPGVHKLKRGVPESIRFAERSPPRSALAGGVEGTGQKENRAGAKRSIAISVKAETLLLRERC